VDGEEIISERWCSKKLQKIANLVECISQCHKTNTNHGRVIVDDKSGIFNRVIIKWPWYRLTMCRKVGKFESEKETTAFKQRNDLNYKDRDLPEHNSGKWEATSGERWEPLLLSQDADLCRNVNFGVLFFTSFFFSVFCHFEQINSPIRDKCNPAITTR